MKSHDILQQSLTDSRNLLVKMLNEAAQLEHSLLNAYLLAASSIRSTPQEFGQVSGQENRRSAIHFEKARIWKQNILKVAKEEMLHLHYVQCLLRGLGEMPHFLLPNRDPESKNWIIPNWHINLSGNLNEEDYKGTEVPLQSYSIDVVRKFMLFESTDALQDDNTFSEKNLEVYRTIFEFEFEFRLESMLYHISDDARRNELKRRLKDIYESTLPLEKKKSKEFHIIKEAAEIEALPELEKLKFQSIAEFYTKGILPLYNQAFEMNWVINTNADLNNELLDPSYAQQGFLPVAPIYRSKNFEKFSSGNRKDPLKNYKHVNDIIKEIVEEGEGATDFITGINQFLDKVSELGGVRKYLQTYMMDRADRSTPTPAWLDQAERLRQSHLYRFAVIFADMLFEQNLSKQAGIDFDVSRQKIEKDGHIAITKITTEIPVQFNAAYLVLTMWLSRIYETNNFEVDKEERYAIEMLASWPLMSLAIRPFLELTSFFDVDLSRMFRFEMDHLPMLPIHAQQLLQLHCSKERSQGINEIMDNLAINVLADVAEWARNAAISFENSEVKIDDKSMIIVRLKALGTLDEFKKQFPFREHGGYSDRMPDTTFVQQSENADKYSEDPTSVDNIFENSLVLRLKFSGFGLVQLSTDPDPPSDEAGCSGTHMLHSEDGNKCFDRALVWQVTNPERQIIRNPRESLPPIGVNINEISLEIASPNAIAGYVPREEMQSAGAVDTSGIQRILKVDGLMNLITFSVDQMTEKGKNIRINLSNKGDSLPLLFGDNHLVWQDGEPIDPFILTIMTDDLQPFMQREVYNEELSMREMTPLQRIKSARAPVGFDSFSAIPDWVVQRLPDNYKNLLFSPGFPVSYLKERAVKLNEVLWDLSSESKLGKKQIDEIISIAERMYHVSTPRGTTVAWLTFLLYYGHTISGNSSTFKQDNPIFTYLQNHLSVPVETHPQKDREKPNSRWLIKYTKGVMDTDAITDLVFGELFIPVIAKKTEKKVSFTRSWEFNLFLYEPLRSYCLKFKKPFWTNEYEVDDSTRKINVDKTTVIETILQQDANRYSYSSSGFENIREFENSLQLEQINGKIIFTWRNDFYFDEEGAFVNILQFIVNTRDSMIEAIKSYLEPKEK